MLDIFIGSHATVFSNRLAFLIHWATFIAFVVFLVSAIYFLATVQYADWWTAPIKLLERVLGARHRYIHEVFIFWGLPLFCTVDWLFTGKITIFPWKR